MSDVTRSKENHFAPLNGFMMLTTIILFFAMMVAGIIYAGKNQAPLPGVGAGVLGLTAFVLLFGFFIVDPNRARVLILFGRYRGTVRDPGFYWTNPFTVKSRVSLRANNFNSDQVKVNDLVGNPIEIAAVVVWEVRDTAQATFDVEHYEDFVRVQSEAAVRLVASRHPYDDDHQEGTTTSLRGSSEVIADELKHEVQQRLERGGIAVIEARLSHLAYAPEIAAAMLQRQQAQAVIVARQKIVEGAVGMVQMALAKLSEQGVVQLDDERKATLVGNLLVVLCGQGQPTPVLNTGSLYN